MFDELYKHWDIRNNQHVTSLHSLFDNLKFRVKNLH